jgi:cobalamin biosynthesis protein CobT
MEAKLTLKLDKRAIDSAKMYAKKHNRSLSRMVEHYFINLDSRLVYQENRSSVVEKLTGILSEDDLKKMAMEDERAEYILTKKI